MPDSLSVLWAPAPGLKLIVAGVRDLANEAAARHDLASGSAAALAQALAGSLLLVAAEDVPAEQARVDLQLDCKGPLRGLLVDADGSGAVRGMVRVGDLDLPQGGLADLLDGKGSDEIGMLSILRRQAGGDEADLQRALVPFAGGDLGRALTGFLQSDRANEGHVVLEGVSGVLVIPDGDDGAAAAGRLADELRDGGLRRSVQAVSNARALAQHIGEALQLGPLQVRSELQPRFSCRCSRERLVRALRALGAPELLDMADKDGGAEACCDFCAETYVVSKEELVALARAAEAV
jgi:molecular chaperone Hsp33